jgi:hypothetical protein
MDGSAPIAVLKRASPTEGGDALCANCIENLETISLDDLAAVCDLCMEQNIIPRCGLLPGADEWDNKQE